MFSFFSFSYRPSSPILSGVFLLGMVGSLGAQSLAPASGFSAQALFSSDPGMTISGMGVASNGNIFYLQEGTGQNTALWVRTASSNYQSAHSLYSFGAEVFGSFVTVSGATVFFGESLNGEIRSMGIDGSNSVSIGTVPFHEDLFVAGGQGYLSHNPGGGTFDPLNVVSLFDLTDGSLHTLLQTTDFSGPVAVDSSGNLLYGGTGFGVGGDIYWFSAAAVSAAVAADPEDPIIFDPNNNRIFLNAGNAGFALVGDNELLSHDFANLNLYDIITLSVQAVASTSDFMGAISALGEDQYFVTVTDFGSGASTVFAVIPEPAQTTGLLGLLIFGAILMQRRRLAVRL